MFKLFLKKLVIFLLTLLARLVLLRYHPKIIAVTGSVGKTATKDAIFAVLEKKFSVGKSPKSFNSDIGVPLAILRSEKSAWGDITGWLSVLLRGFFMTFYFSRYPEWLVLELGVDRPGDMARLTRYIKPDCVVVTRFGETPVHLEFFPSREALVKEKALLVRALKKDGFLVVNMDDPDAYALRKETAAKIITYGANENALFRVSYKAFAYRKEDNFPEGVIAKLEFDGKMIPFSLSGTLGLHYVSSALAAFAVGHELGLSVLDAAAQLKTMTFPPGRMSILEGIRGSVIIDDSYNSSPVAIGAALHAFKELSVSGRKIAVLGDMLELGEASDSEHKKAGERAAVVAGYLVTVGVRARLMRDGFLGKGMSAENMSHFDSSAEAGTFLKEFVEKGDAILVKGSQGMRMERAVAAILAHPEKQKELLVRQEKEWEGKV